MIHKKLSGALAGAAVVGALLVGANASASTPVNSPAPALPTHTQVRLVTGDLVTLSIDSSGRQTASVAPSGRHGVASIYRTFNIGHDLFVVPQSAAPYLGTTLDPSLFDVTRLAQHPKTSLSVHVTLRAGAESASLPGISLRADSATQASGRFTVAGARIFGDALARQASHDIAAGARSVGMFRSVAGVSSAGASSVSQATRPAASHTLTVKGIDWNGNPDNGDSVNVYNVDDLNLFATTLTFSSGQAQATVPDGHYSLISFFFDFSSANIYEVSVPQVTVSKDTTVTLDARDATSKISVSTPKPAPQPVFIVEWARTDANGLASSYTFLASDAFTFYVAPTKKKPSVGQMYQAVQIRAQSTGGKKAYEYDAKFSNTGTIDADQSYVVKKGNVATIDTGIATDVSGQLALDGRFAAYPWESFLIVGDIQFSLPTSRTEYYSTGGGLTWERFEFTVWDPNNGIIQGDVESPWEQLSAGVKRTEIFSGEPTHPRLFEHAITWNPAITYCPACVTPTNLDAIVFPFSDNSQYHRGYPDSAASGLNETQSWSIKADKTVIGQGSGFFQASVPLDPDAKSYTLAYKTHRSSSSFTLSTDINTSWKVMTDAPQADLPDGWVCSGSGDSDCTVLPLMTNDYDLGADLLGQVASGDRTGSVTIGHLVDAKVAVKKVAVSFSYDGGKTWTAATVKKGDNGEYSVAFTVPNKGQTDGFGAVKLSAKDAAGGSLKQTILRAFAVK